MLNPTTLNTNLSNTQNNNSTSSNNQSSDYAKIQADALASYKENTVTTPRLTASEIEQLNISKLSLKEKLSINKHKQNWEKASSKKNVTEMNRSHALAEYIRVKNGFTGGNTGNEYIALSKNQQSELLQKLYYDINKDSIRYSNYTEINPTNIIANNNESLGYLSNINEGKVTSINPGTWDNTGGKSYGAFQFAGRMTADGNWIDGYSSQNNEMQGFLNWLSTQNTEMYNKLMTAKNLDGDKYGTNFDNAYLDIANTQGNELYNLQFQYATNNWYTPALEKIQNQSGINVQNRSLALQNVLFSTAIQHGVSGASTIFSKLNYDLSDEELIKQIYEVERPKYTTKYPSIINGRFVTEKNTALQMLSNEQNL